MEENKGCKTALIRKRINQGSIVSALGLVLYMVVVAVGRQTLAGVLSIPFAAISAWTCMTASELRRKDKEAVSYNVLWGTGAVMILLVVCAVMNVKLWLGF